MAIQNISKYVQINDFLLVEYEFSRDGTLLTNIDVGGGKVVVTDSSVKQYYNTNISSESLGTTNNILELNSILTNSNWFTSTNIDDYVPYFDSSTVISESYEYDTIKVHVVSGYNFDDVAGFLLQVQAEDVSSNLVNLSNFTYLKQTISQGSNVVKFAQNALFLGNRFYDKYVTFKVPSVYALGGQSATTLESQLLIKPLSDVYLTYGTIATVQGVASSSSTFNLSDSTSLQLPVTSSADNFNAFIAESTSGDFIEFYATWKDIIIGEYMGDIESGRISLYTSNNPNDNYEEFAEIYGSDQVKWVLIHEITVYENLPGATSGSSLISQKYTFTQEGNFTLPNYFRPVLKNADIDASFTIQYVCRLTNRMDGTQIIRRASFASTDPKKYGLKFTRLTVENVIPYKVFNRIEEGAGVTVQGQSNIRTKYSKVFFDSTNIFYDQNHMLFPNGLGPLFLKNGDSVYKFKFGRFNELTNQKENVDLSGAYNYALMFTMDNRSTMEIVPTYTSNMNTIIGELEFKLSEDQITKLLKQTQKKYSLVVKNPDGSHYTFYEGDYYKISEQSSVIKKLEKLYPTTELKAEIIELTKELERVNGLLENCKGNYNRMHARYNAAVAGDKIDDSDYEEVINDLQKRIVDLSGDKKQLEEEIVAKDERYNDLKVGQQKVEEKPEIENRKPEAEKAEGMPNDVIDIREDLSDEDNDVIVNPKTGTGKPRGPSGYGTLEEN